MSQTVNAANNPYQVYGLYLHPSGGEATLQADAEKKQYYTNKGFTFLAYVPSPGVTPAGPRDIDRNDSGIPAGPDGSTHERHPGEITPDGAPVPWGFPLVGVAGVVSTPVTRSTMKQMGLKVDDPKEGVAVDDGSGSGGPRGASTRQKAFEDLRGQEERRIRGLLREKHVPDEVEVGGQTRKGEHDRIVGMALAHLRSPEDEMNQLAREATLPGVLVETGVTRGVAGIDVSMPSVVPGIAPTDQTGQRAAAARGEVEYEDVELEGGYVVRVPRASAKLRAFLGMPGPADAPGSTGAGASTPQAPDPTVTDQARHQEVRQGAMQAEGEAEGRTVATPAKSSGSSGSGSSRSTPSRRR